jgi:hypothetical protein
LLSFALGTLTDDLLGARGANYAEAYGLIAASAVVVAVGLVIVRRRLRRVLTTETRRHGEETEN